jgi:RNA polymerase sigma-70 factor (ECF subfamily)
VNNVNASGPYNFQSSKTINETLNGLNELSGAGALKILALRRDDAAWTVILQRYGVEILQVTRRILGEESLAEDASQETLLQIRDRADQFKGGNLPPAQAEAAARNWIMRIACNTALDILRTRKRAKHREEVVAYRDEPIEVETMFEAQEREKLANMVRGELAQMSEKQRRPLMLHFFGGLSYEQIAQELRCTMGAARVRVHRALSKLRERMNALGVMFTAAALYALIEGLQNSVVHAAEAALSPERMMQWQGLLNTAQTATCNFASDPHTPLLIRTGYAAAVAVLCGSLTFSTTGTFSTQRPQDQRHRSPPPQKTAPVIELACFERLPSTNLTGLPGFKAVPPSAESVETRFSKMLNERTRVQHPVISKRTEETAVQKVSLIAQLKLLKMMQQGINQRIESLQKELSASSKFDKNTASDAIREINTRLEKAASEQEEVARLLGLLATEIETGLSNTIHVPETGNGN